MTLTPSMRSTLTREPAGMAGQPLLGAGGPGGAVHGDLALGLQVVDGLGDHTFGADDPVGVGTLPAGIGVLPGQGADDDQTQEGHRQEHSKLHPDVAHKEGCEQGAQGAYREPQGNQPHRGGLQRQEGDEGGEPADAWYGHGHSSFRNTTAILAQLGEKGKQIRFPDLPSREK